MFFYSYSFEISISDKVLEKILEIEVLQWRNNFVSFVNPGVPFWKFRLDGVGLASDDPQFISNSIFSINRDMDCSEFDIVVIDGDSNSDICNIKVCRVMAS